MDEAVQGAVGEPAGSGLAECVTARVRVNRGGLVQVGRSTCGLATAALKWGLGVHSFNRPIVIACRAGLVFCRQPGAHILHVGGKGP